MDDSICSSIQDQNKCLCLQFEEENNPVTLTTEVIDTENVSIAVWLFYAVYFSALCR